MAAKRIETEVLIVGTGPIGATYARLLAPHRKVLMIDSGPQMSKKPGEHMLNPYAYQVMPNISLGSLYGQDQLYSIAGEPSQPQYPNEKAGSAKEDPGNQIFQPPYSRLNFNNPEQNPNMDMPNAAAMYMVGGMGTAWSCFAPTPQPFERTPLISRAEWNATLRVANRLFNANTEAFAGSAVVRALRKVLEEDAGLDLQDSVVAAEKLFDTPQTHVVRWTATDTILGPLLDPGDPRSKNLRILAEHRAERMVVKSGKVKKVEVRSLATNEVFKIYADQVVVAGNAFLTPRLLWQSGIRPWALGRYLCEHMIATCTVGLNNRVAAALREDRENPARGARIPVAWNDPAPKCGFPPTKEKLWICHFNRTARYLSYTDATWDARCLMDMTWYGPVEQRPDNRMHFSRTQVDRFGQPQINIDYMLSPEDTRLFERMMLDLEDLVPHVGAYLPIQTSSLNAQGEAKPIYQPAGSSLHFMGTYRMGNDSSQETSVVDTSSRVWGMDNLWLGGPGVIPNLVASNPTLTAAAIAVKSAADVLGSSVKAVEKEVMKG